MGRKQKQNQQEKHRVGFEEAQTVFLDEEALIIEDIEHSEQEDRFIILGTSTKSNLLVVCHCYRESETVIRLISARKATKAEINIMTECEVTSMKDEYDFSNGRKNPYAKILKQQITINIEPDTISYFKSMASETGVPYQTLINLFLKYCKDKGLRPDLSWN